MTKLLCACSGNTEHFPPPPTAPILAHFLTQKIAEPIHPGGQSTPWSLTPEAQPKGCLLRSPLSAPALHPPLLWAGHGPALLARSLGPGASPHWCGGQDVGPSRRETLRVPANISRLARSGYHARVGGMGLKQQAGRSPFPRSPAQGPPSSTIYLQASFIDVPGPVPGRPRAPPGPLRSCCVVAPPSLRQGNHIPPGAPEVPGMHPSWTPPAPGKGPQPHLQPLETERLGLLRQAPRAWLWPRPLRAVDSASSDTEIRPSTSPCLILLRASQASSPSPAPYPGGLMAPSFTTTPLRSHIAPTRGLAPEARGAAQSYPRGSWSTWC